MNIVLVIQQVQKQECQLIISFSLLVPTSCYQIRELYSELCSYMNHPALTLAGSPSASHMCYKHGMTNVCVKMQKCEIVSVETMPSV